MSRVVFERDYHQVTAGHLDKGPAFFVGEAIGAGGRLIDMGHLKGYEYRIVDGDGPGISFTEGKKDRRKRFGVEARAGASGNQPVVRSFFKVAEVHFVETKKRMAGYRLAQRFLGSPKEGESLGLAGLLKERGSFEHGLFGGGCKSFLDGDGLGRDSLDVKAAGGAGNGEGSRNFSAMGDGDFGEGWMADVVV